MEDLVKRVEDLETLVRKHQHTQTDHTQPLPYKKIYMGIVNSNGTAGTIFPIGWSVAKNGTGDYIITHNLGTTNYAFFGSPFFVGYTATVNTGAQGLAATVEVGTYGAGSVTDAAFYFMIILL